MPKRKDINSILIIGAGPIIIGQACEFDYSGAQACKALKEEGFRVILVNSNPATIMTDPLMADATYIEPIHWKSVEKIIKSLISGSMAQLLKTVVPFAWLAAIIKFSVAPTDIFENRILFPINPFGAVA